MSDSFDPWTVTCPLPMGFPRQEYWWELPCPPLGHLPNPGMNPHLLHWQVDSLPLSHQGSNCIHSSDKNSLGRVVGQICVFNNTILGVIQSLQRGKKKQTPNKQKYPKRETNKPPARKLLQSPRRAEMTWPHLRQLVIHWKMRVTRSCPTLCDPMDYNPWNSPGQNTGVGSCSLLQGIFPTQGSNPGLPHRRQILDCLSHQGSPRKRREKLTL